MAFWGSSGQGGQLIIFDSDSNSIIDNAERLGGQLPIYYLQRANHAGVQPGTTVTYDNTASGMVATQVQAAIDEVDVRLDNLESGLVASGNANNLNSQPGSYYLDRTNHTNTQPATTVAFNNVVSGLLATHVQAALDEIDQRIDDIVSGTIQVGDALKLAAQLPAYYLARANHTGNQPATTVTYSGVTSGLVAADVQAAIDEVDSNVDDILSGATPAGDSLLLQGQNSAYHLNRTNHTGTQAATTVTFNNAGTGLVAADVQAAIVEFKGLFDLHTHTKAQITDFVEADYVHTSGNESINGDKDFQNNVRVFGNLTVQGTTTYIDTANMRIKDNEIEVNYGEIGAGVSAGTAGMRIRRGSLQDAVFFFDEADDKFKLDVAGVINNIGNMEKSVYDANNNGIVDNAENAQQLNSQLPAFYLDRANHTGSDPASAIAYNNITSGLVATTVQAAIDELASTKMTKSIYDSNNDGIVNQADLASDSLKLNNQAAAFYLARANHTGTQPGTTVTYNNTATGAVADDVQEALDELFFTKMRILSYDSNQDNKVNAADLADDSLKLGNQLPTYYLNRTNHTGLQAATTVSYDNTASGLVAVQVQAAIDELKALIVTLTGGAGDMLKSVYDPNNDGKVSLAEFADNSGLLGNQNSAFHLNRANHSGTQVATTVTYDNSASLLSPAANVQAAIDTLASTRMQKAIYDTDDDGKVDLAELADDSLLLGGQNSSYHLNRANHSGVQPATSVTFANAGTGLASSDVQAAIAELAALVDLDQDDVVDHAELADNATQFGAQLPAYYLNRANHTGQIASADISDAGMPNGVATLGPTGQLQPSQIPGQLLGAMTYQQTWNANTNSPNLQSGIGVKGYWYRVSVAGTTNLDGETDWQIGDELYYDGSIWRKNDNTSTGASSWLVLSGHKLFNDDVSSLEFGKIGYFGGYLYIAIVQGTGGAGRWARVPVSTSGF